MAGCTAMQGGKPPGPWYEAYQPINDPVTDAFMSNALARAEAEFGDPVVPINKIIMRRSRKTDAARHYRIGEDFSLTECIDPTNGVFVVYIGVDSDHSNYYALLAHECVHLLNAQVTDWYMEGLATVFSEQTCAAMGKKWGDWKDYFMKSRRYPYALSYRMMLELQEAFPDEYPSLVRYTAPNENGSKKWLRIDIDRWIATLPADRQEEAVEIIDRYAPVLRSNINNIYDFTVPHGP